MTVVALWFVLVFPWHRSEVHGSLKTKTSQSNRVDGAGSAFSLFRRWVYFTFQSPLLLPTHSSFSGAKLWRRRSNTGNQKPAALRIFATGWTELRGKVGHGSCAHTLSNKKAHTWGKAHIHSHVKSIYPLWGNVHHVSAGWSSTSCQGCVFIFLDAHSVTSPRLFMHEGEIIHAVIWGPPSSLSFYQCFASGKPNVTLKTDVRLWRKPKIAASNENKPDTYSSKLGTTHCPSQQSVKTTIW